MMGRLIKVDEGSADTQTSLSVRGLACLPTAGSFLAFYIFYSLIHFIRSRFQFYFAPLKSFTKCCIFYDVFFKADQFG